MEQVMDVSRWQGKINWEQVKASGAVDGVMLRVLGSKSGKPYLDPTFEQNYSECARLGIPVGGYYYMDAVTTGAMGNELTMLHSALEGKSFQMPIAVDVEDAKLRALRQDELTKLVKQAAKKIESWGLYAMVYTYTNFADTALNMFELTDFDLWIADYRSKRPTRKHGMWQYTSKGRVTGVDGPVDLSHAYKNYPSIIQRAGLTQVKGA